MSSPLNRRGPTKDDPAVRGPGVTRSNTQARSRLFRKPARVDPGVTASGSPEVGRGTSAKVRSLDQTREPDEDGSKLQSPQ